MKSIKTKVLAFVLATLVAVMMMGMTALAAGSSTTSNSSSSNTTTTATTTTIGGAGGAATAQEAALLKGLATGVKATTADGKEVTLSAVHDQGVLTGALWEATSGDAAAVLQVLYGLTAKQAQQVLASAQIVAAVDIKAAGGAVTLSIPGVTPGMVLLAIHQNANGTFNLIPCVVNANGTVTVNSPSYSPVIFVNYAVAGATTTNLLLSPRTGQTLPIALISVLTVSVAGAAVFAIKAKKAK